MGIDYIWNSKLLHDVVLGGMQIAVDQFQPAESEFELWRATLRASASADSDSVGISAQFHRWQSPRPTRAWQRSSDRDCKQLGTNPFLTPFNVFVPLTRCLTFGVHSRVSKVVHCCCT